MKMKHLFLYCLLLFSPFGGKITGQSNYYREAIFHNLTVDDGLGHRTANTIIQDHDGYIWIGTNNGLNRYDGHQMTVFRSDINHPFSLPGNRIAKLLISKKGKLWILTEAGRLCWYESAQDRFVPFKLTKNKERQHIRDITEDEQGNLWVLTYQNEIYKSIDEKSILVKQLTDTRSVIGSIIISAQNTLWVEVFNEGIRQYTFQADTLSLQQDFTALGPLKIIEGAGGKVWFSKHHTIYESDLEAGVFSIKEFCDLRLILPNVKGDIRSVQLDKKGRIWVAINGFGLVQLKKNDRLFSYRHYPGNSKIGRGLGNNHIMDLFIDKYNVLWVGSQAGVFSNYLNQKPFYQISKAEGQEENLINNIVHAIHRNQYLWIGTRDGLSVIDTSKHQFYNYKRVSGRTIDQDEGGISCFLQDSKGNLWIGTNGAGLFKVKNPHEPAKLTFLPVASDNSPHSRLLSNSIVDLVEDDWGRIWVGTDTKGIYILNPPSKSGHDDYDFKQVLSDGSLTNLYKDPFENTIWAGSWRRGVIKISLTSPAQQEISYFQREENNRNSLSYNHVNPMLKTDPKTLWVGSIGGGLNKMTFLSQDSVVFQHFTTHNGLSDNTIHSILGDNAGHLWLGGTGLTRFDPEQEKTIHYDTHDGLQSNLFIINSAFKDSIGRLYFGGPYGLNFFTPSVIQKEESYPDVVLSSLKILDQKIKVGEKVNGRVILTKALNQSTQMLIKEKENDLTFDFLTIHTATPSKNRLQYRLKGLQEDWVAVDRSQASITYSNLDPGDYTFQLRASNGDGIWSPITKNLQIEIRPYWYKTNWAYGSYILLCLALLWLFRRTILIQNNLRNDLKFAQIEIQKDQELAEIKARFFDNITHELRTPLTLIKGPIEELLTNRKILVDVRKNYYYIIHQNAQKLFYLVNRLLDFRKAESDYFQLEAAKDDIVLFAEEIYLAFQQLAQDKGVKYSFEKAPGQLPLFFDKEKMEIVLYNLLTNAFKYSAKGDEVKLSIRQEGTNCLITVADTGKGMSQDKVDRIFDRFYQIAKTESTGILGTGIGLSMVKNIIDLHQGTIQVETALGQGSSFYLRLPLGSQHLLAEQIVNPVEDVEELEYYQVHELEKETQVHAEAKTQQLLIVEDNQEIRAFIKAVFIHQFLIQEAANGVEGLAVIEKHPPDIIISDIMMDQMDGITFCKKVRDNPIYAHIPFILLTARTSNIYQVDGLDSGADAYITKPFNPQVLKAQVENLLKLRITLKAYYANRITLGPKKIEVNAEEVVFLESLIEQIEQEIGENLTAEKLAASMSMSHSTLYRKIKSYTGESINSFIRSIRLKQAANLLVDSDLNISQVAYKVGFSDINYFGKCFKQQFHMSPSAFIKSEVGNRKS